jgi:DNA processing protein
VLDEGVPAPVGFPPAFADGPGEREAALLLRCLLGILPRTLHVLAWREGTAQGCVDAIRAGVAGSDRDRAFIANTEPSSIFRSLREIGARFVVPGEDGYWPAFVRLADPPVGVFLRGAALGAAEQRVAVVGTRRPTALGREVAHDLSSGLAGAGVGVVSGGAIGIDAAAHRGALAVGGQTVAVLGSGIDVLYPSTNRDLLKQIAVSGTLVSEYPPGVPAEPHRFPARNRLVAALSRGVVIVEGALRSGTRITAEHAMELGLDVFAVPGPVTSPLAETPLELIREGATLVRGSDDLLADLGIERVAVRRGSPATLPQDEARVYGALGMPSLPDAVARAVGCSIADAVAALIRLELRGLVRGVGGRYERTFPRSAG